MAGGGIEKSLAESEKQTAAVAAANIQGDYIGQTATFSVVDAVVQRTTRRRQQWEENLLAVRQREAALSGTSPEAPANRLSTETIYTKHQIAQVALAGLSSR